MYVLFLVPIYTSLWLKGLPLLIIIIIIKFHNFCLTSFQPLLRRFPFPVPPLSSPPTPSNSTCPPMLLPYHTILTCKRRVIT